MEFGSRELIDSVRTARAGFLKHIDGVSEDQATWKPYEPCKSISETLDHLLWSDHAVLELLQSGKEADYSNVPTAPPAESHLTLRGKLIVSHAALIDYLQENYAGKALDTVVSYYGQPTPLGQMLGSLHVEEGYHTGQVSFIRQATDPSWDYYAAIYG